LLKKVASRMPPLLPQIQADQAISIEAMMLRLAEAEMALGPRKAKNSISGTNFTTKSMLNMV
jgi:hypothetical protein